MTPLYLAALLLAADPKEPPKKEPAPADADRKKQELAWAKGVAEDFLRAGLAGHPDMAGQLLTDSLRKEYKDNQSVWRPIEGLQVWRSFKLTEEVISPDADEASFRGTLADEKGVAGQDVSLRVAKDTPGGKWRVAFFTFKDIKK